MQAFIELDRERREAHDELKVTKQQLHDSQQKVTDHSDELKAFNYDWDDPLQEHDRYKAQAKLASKYKRLFNEKITEVYNAQVQLR